jgi:hypothetical protein
MANLFDNTQRQGSGSLASLYKPGPASNNGYINVTKDFPWTLSQSVRESAPIVFLKEFEINENQIKRQSLFYGAGTVNAFGTRDILDVYSQLYPKDRETGFTYSFPYFSDINFEVNTPMWDSLDTLEAAKNTITGIAGALGGKDVQQLIGKGIDVVGAGAMAGLAAMYPKVGITDRPRLWNSHEPRSIAVKFPLFNTYGPDDWFKNRELCELLVNQNLYNKRDFITSVPPVFYELTIPGQHFSIASCVTNLTIYNRGNMRILDRNGKKYNVPDVYEINITFTDMVMPSKNMFQSINESKVTTELVGTQFAATATTQQSTRSFESEPTFRSAITPSSQFTEPLNLR